MFYWLCLRKWSCINILLFSTTDGSGRVEWMKPGFLSICLLIALHCNQLSLTSCSLCHRPCRRHSVLYWGQSRVPGQAACVITDHVADVGKKVSWLLLPFLFLCGDRQKCKDLFPNPTSAGDPIGCAGMSTLSWPARICGMSTDVVATL